MKQAKTSEVERIEAGDYRNIDTYVAELREAGFDVSYENLWDGTSGFFAKVMVNDQIHAYFEGGPTGDMVKEVRLPLFDIEAHSFVSIGDHMLHKTDDSKKLYECQFCGRKSELIQTFDKTSCDLNGRGT